MKDELMRRISNAFDSADGIAGDEALQETLRSDPEAAKYAKDVARVNKWLAVWPMPEPDDAAYEALAARIEQRLDESLPTSSDPTSPPVFDDDDALRDSTASLLQPAEPTGEFSAVRSGEYKVSDSSLQLITDPGLTEAAVAIDEPSEPRPVSPIAKVTLKQRKPLIVEDIAPEHASGEPRSAAELELKLVESRSGETSLEPAAKPKKKKKKSESAPATTPAPAKLAPPAPAPTPPPQATTVARREERKPVATLWWFAAAAAVGLGAFGAATLYEDEAAAPVASTPVVAAPAIAAFVPAATAPPATEAPTAAVAPVTDTIAAEPSEAALPATVVATATPIDSQASTRGRAQRDDTPLAAPARIAASGSGGARRSGGAGGAGADDLAGPIGGGTPTTSVARAPSAPAPAPPPPPEPSAEATASTTAPAHAHASTPGPAPSDLPDTPDRDTIQAVLAGRLDAVRECAQGAHGLADVDVVIASTGRITTATVNGPFAGTPVGSCIARAVRGARFPAFTQPRFEVTYPYHL